MRPLDEQRLQQNLRLLSELEPLPMEEFTAGELRMIEGLIHETNILLKAAARKDLTRKSQTPAGERKCRFVFGEDGVWRWVCDGSLVTEKDELSWLMD